MSDFRPHVLRAVEIVGGQSELARRIGLSQPSVNDLCYRTKTLRPEVALKIETATDGLVSRFELLPTVWPPAAPKTDMQSAAGPSAGASDDAPAAFSGEAA